MKKDSRLQKGLTLLVWSKLERLKVDYGSELLLYLMLAIELVHVSELWELRRLDWTGWFSVHL